MNADLSFETETEREHADAHQRAHCVHISLPLKQVNCLDTRFQNVRKRRRIN